MTDPQSFALPRKQTNKYNSANYATSGRILFAGGCHIKGYPGGESSNFSHLTSAALGYTSSRIAPITLGNPSRLFEHLEFHCPPDIAILQFGSDEAPQPIATHPNSLLKRAYASAMQRVHPPLFEADALRFGLRSLLSYIAPFQIPITVVLTPLPCADDMARSFRMAAAPIFHEESARAGVLSLDTAAVLGYATRRAKCGFDIYADERNLNPLGHQLLADSLTRLIEYHLPNTAPAAAELELAIA